jgi:phage terminase small subunit
MNPSRRCPIAKRGPKPTLKTFDPVTNPGMPSMPTTLQDDASAAWDQLAEVLGERGTVTPGDVFSMEMLAEALVRWRRDVVAEADVGPVTESGAVPGFKESPESQALGRSTKILLSLLVQHGLTPRSRLDVRSSSEGGRSGTDGYAKFKAMLGRAKA